MERNLPRSRHCENTPSDKAWLERHVFFTWLSIAITVAASALLACDVVSTLEGRIKFGRACLVFEQVVFITIVAFLIYGNLVYHAARLGFLKRRLAHEPTPRARVEAIYDFLNPPSLTVLVPSYREEIRVVRQTLLSAALTEYPGRRIALLIDDPPDPSEEWAKTALLTMRELPNELAALLQGPAERFEMRWPSSACANSKVGSTFRSRGSD